MTELGRTAEEYKIGRIRLTYQTGKLILLVKETITEMGYEYTETYINQEEINGLIREQLPDMFFWRNYRMTQVNSLIDLGMSVRQYID